MSSDNKCRIIIKGSDLEEMKTHLNQGMPIQDILSNPQLHVLYVETTTDENFPLTPPKGYCSLMLPAQIYLQYCSEVTIIDQEVINLNINLHRLDMSEWFSRVDQYNIKTFGFNLDDKIQLQDFDIWLQILISWTAKSTQYHEKITNILNYLRNNKGNKSYLPESYWEGDDMFEHLNLPFPFYILGSTDYSNKRIKSITYQNITGDTTAYEYNISEPL